MEFELQGGYSEESNLVYRGSQGNQVSSIIRNNQDPESHEKKQRRIKRRLTDNSVNMSDVWKYVFCVAFNISVVLYAYYQYQTDPEYIKTNSNNLSCLDFKRSHQDFTLMIKYPKKPFEKQNKFMFIGQDQLGKVTEKHALDQSYSPMYFMLKNLNRLGRVKYVLFNQQDSDSDSETDQQKAISTKGIIAIDYDSKSGFIIHHSLKNYPIFDSTANKIEFGQMFEQQAQHFLCVSANVESLEDILGNLMTAGVHIYQSTFQEDELVRIQNDVEIKHFGEKVTRQRELEFNSTGGVPFTMFIETRSGNQPNQLHKKVQNKIQDQMLVFSKHSESFEPAKNGRHSLQIVNALQDNLNIHQPLWKPQESDSHWMISKGDSAQKRWVCLGDVTRVQQVVRSNMYICFQNKDFHGFLHKLIKSDQISM